MPFIKSLKKSKEKLQETYELNYNKILKKLENTFYSILKNKSPNKLLLITIKLNSENNKYLLQSLFEKLIYKEKYTIITNLIYNIINKISISEFENKLLNIINYNIVYKDEIISDIEPVDKTLNILSNIDNIYGFIILNKGKINLLKYTEGKKIKQSFIIDKTKISSIIKNRYILLKTQKINKIFTFLEYTKSEYLPPQFKIIDYEAKGVKKSVKGIACTSKLINNILEYINKFKKNITFTEINKNKFRNCNNLELIMRINNTENIFSSGEEIYFMGPELFWIWKNNQ